MSFLLDNGSIIPDSGLEHHYDVQSQSGVDPFVDQRASNDLAASGGPTRQSGDINGFDSINVDGVDDSYQGNFSPVGPNGEWAVAWVGRFYVDGRKFQYGFVNGDLNIDGFGFGIPDNSDNWAVVQTGDNIRVGSTDSNLHKFIIGYDGTDVYIEIDGTVVGSGGLPEPSPSGSLSIGGDYVDLTYRGLDVGEFLWYSEHKDSSERQEIRNYFDRWGF